MFSRPIAAAAAVVVIASALAACGGSDDDKSTGSSGSPGSGAAAAPTKSPLDVFFINEQGSTTGASYPQETAAAKATVEYINTKLGGVDGHPIKLTTCFTDTTPASTTTCANKAVSANPVVITAGTLATDDSIIAVTGKTDIPYVSNAGYTADTLTAKGKAFIVSNYADAIDTAFPILMKRNGVKKVAEIYVNVPAVVNGLLPLTKKAFDAQGIAYDLYPVPYPSSDLTPTISAIARTDADAIQFQTDPVTCGAALNAIKTFQFTKPLYGGSACRTAANNAIVSSLPQTVYGQLGALPGDSDDPDAAALREVFAAAGLKDKLNDQWAVDGFTDIMNIYGALKKASQAGGDITSASLVKALEDGGIHQFLMGKNATFTCDGTVLPDLPALCSLTALVGVWKGDKIENVETINGADVFKK